MGTTQEIKFDQGKKNRRQNLQLGLQIWKPRWFYRRQCIDTLSRKKVPKPRKRLAVILGWPDLGDGLAPDDVTLYFQNGGGGNFSFCQAHHMLLPPV